MSQAQQLIKGKLPAEMDRLRFSDPVTIRTMTLLVMIALLLVLPALPAYAQGPGGAITDAFRSIIETVTGILQGLAVVAGILGLTLWGFSKIARPVFPELSALTQQYIGSFMIGIAVIYVATTIVETIAGELEGVGG
jgi:hypothetical protein